jgi:uncharacterized protein (TIGR02599 family)
MKNTRSQTAFTLIEVLVASGIVVVIMGVLLTMTDQTQRLVRSTSSKVEQFQDARVGFESMTRRLSQATLNAFWDYQYRVEQDPVRGQVVSIDPSRGYKRAAELRFVSGPVGLLDTKLKNTCVSHAAFFQAPIGAVDDKTNYGVLDNLLNTWGYFVEVGDDLNDLPGFLQNKVPVRRRYRLMEFMQPSERLSVYTLRNQGGSTLWFSDFTAGSNRPVRVLAENIVALVILPRLSVADEEQWRRKNGRPAPSLAPNKYQYDSTSVGPNGSDPLLNTFNQLPPVLQVVMVAIDEVSAQRLQDDPQYGNDAKLGIGYDPDPFSGRTLFENPNLLEDQSSGIPGDISRLEKILTSRKASYRVFATNVSIRGAKWSRSQSN